LAVDCCYHPIGGWFKSHLYSHARCGVAGPDTTLRVAEPFVWPTNACRLINCPVPIADLSLSTLPGYTSFSSFTFFVSIFCFLIFDGWFGFSLLVCFFRCFFLLVQVQPLRPVLWCCVTGMFVARSLSVFHHVCCFTRVLGV